MASVSRMDDLEVAWAELHEVNASLGWYVGMPVLRTPRRMAALAFDQTERPKVRRRSREWTAIAPTQERVVREMARCLREISEGRVPK
jgi:hypothetical protein